LSHTKRARLRCRVVEVSRHAFWEISLLGIKDSLYVTEQYEIWIEI